MSSALGEDCSDERPRNSGQRVWDVSSRGPLPGKIRAKVRMEFEELLRPTETPSRLEARVDSGISHHLERVDSNRSIRSYG